MLRKELFIGYKIGSKADESDDKHEGLENIT